MLIHILLKEIRIKIMQLFLLIIVYITLLLYYAIILVKVFFNA